VREEFGYRAENVSGLLSPGAVEECTHSHSRRSYVRARPANRKRWYKPRSQSDERRTVFVIAHRLQPFAAQTVLLSSKTARSLTSARTRVDDKAGTYRRLYELQFDLAESPRAGVAQVLR